MKNLILMMPKKFFEHKAINKKKLPENKIKVVRN